MGVDAAVWEPLPALSAPLPSLDHPMAEELASAPGRSSPDLESIQRGVLSGVPPLLGGNLRGWPEGWKRQVEW
jgi:hypothetical protein